MSSIEQSTILMIELLSLEHKQAGYQIEVGLTRNVGYARYVLPIDEFTYNQISSLGLFTGARVRLSPYPKKDPFQNKHYSTLIKMNKTFSETLYFACSEEYVSQIHQFKQQDYNNLDEHEGIYSSSATLDETAQRNAVAIAGRLGYVALRYIMLVVVLFLLTMRMDGELPVDGADIQVVARIDADSGHSTLPYVPLIQTAAFQSEPAPPSLTSSEPLQEQLLSYYENVIDEDNYEYGLPKGYVALSFDDGPSQYTKEIVDILKANDVVATFLFVGQNVKKRPEEVKYANAQGMLIGNHSWDHSKMTGNSDQVNRANLMKANQALEELISTPITIFRPPYGAINDKLDSQVKQQHMKVLLWNRDPQDWRAGGPEEILNYFHTVDSSGGIFLLHERRITVEALPGIISYLKGKNLKFALFK